jgi:sulfate/thiosulfate transport system permease protein
MATIAISRPATTAPRAVTRATGESRAVRYTLIGIALVFLALVLLLPLVLVFVQAFAKGLPAYWEAIREPDALSAAKLTLLIAAIAVPANLVFGVAAAWCISKFEFRGKNLLITLIDQP